MTLGLTEAIAALETVREQLGAFSVSAEISTRHGMVAVTVAPDGHRLYVNGQEVPQGAVD